MEVSSIKGELSFFSVAITTPFFAFMPSEVSPLATAARAFSICGSFPELWLRARTFGGESCQREVAHLKMI